MMDRFNQDCRCHSFNSSKIQYAKILESKMQNIMTISSLINCHFIFFLVFGTRLALTGDSVEIPLTGTSDSTATASNKAKAFTQKNTKIETKNIACQRTPSSKSLQHQSFRGSAKYDECAHQRHVGNVLSGLLFGMHHRIHTEVRRLRCLSSGRFFVQLMLHMKSK